MRPFAFVPLALTVLVAAPVAAQTGSEPNLVLTVLGGAVTGHDLWTVGKQPLCVIPSGGGTCTSNYDTLQLSRQIGASLVIGVAATYFPWPHVGFHAEISYLGLPSDDGCNGLFYNADVENKNQQICDDIQARAGYGGAVSLFTGVTVRAATRSTVSPYVRGSVGLVSQNRSSIEMAGAFTDGTGFHERLIVADATPRTTMPMFGLAAGFTSPLSPGYQFRLELRDGIVSMDRLAGPVNALGNGPIASRYYHHLALTLAFDVVLERKRGRRY